jgi:hypothetical protein
MAARAARRAWLALAFERAVVAALACVVVRASELERERADSGEVHSHKRRDEA